MLNSPKPHHLKKLFLKCCALLFGYSLWLGFTEHHKIQKTISVPLTFFNVLDDIKIEAPETVQLSLYGTRRALANAHYKASIHCNAAQYTQEKQILTLHNQQIFLPKNVRLLHCIPSTITLEIKQS